MMEAFESKAERACASMQIPGFVVGAYSYGNNIQYSRATGYAHMPHGENDSGQKMTLDTPMVVASVAKLPTCVAVMQCVEKKLLHLDEPVSLILPELANPKILYPKWGSGRQTTSKPPQLTLRMLLMHTSGLSYADEPHMAFCHPDIVNIDHVTKFVKAKSATEMQPYVAEMQQILRRLFDYTTLLHTPCVRWQYSPGIDWAGRMVERVTHMSLEAYCRKHIFDPLGMTRTSFRLSHPAIKGKLGTLYFRNRLTRACEPTEPTHASDSDYGGHGLITTCNDYMRLLTALTGRDGTLLQSETVEYMLSCRTLLPQADLGDIKKKLLFRVVDSDTPVDHCLAGAIVDYPPSNNKPSSGTVMWMGANSIFWWIDPVKRVCGYYAAHTVTRADRNINRDMFTAFQAALYTYLSQHPRSKI